MSIPTRANRTLLVICLAFIVVVTGAAWTTGLWVLTALPIGLVFGFLLERADLCGAAAFSEIVLLRDDRKAAGLWVAIVTSMLVFALAASLGWIQLNPKPLLWLSYLVGGAIFGVGMVLAGGCVSGTLFKVGQGNLNSMAALVAVPLGVAAVEYGPLHGAHVSMKSHVVRAADGGSVTLSSVTGLSYPNLAVIIAALSAIAVALLRRRRGPKRAEAEAKQRHGGREWLAKPWKPWAVGLAIGVLALGAYVSSAASGRNYPFGVTHGPLHLHSLITGKPTLHIWKPKPKPQAGSPSAQPPSPAGQRAAKLPEKAGKSTPPPKKVVWWLVGLVVFLVAGSHLSARMRGSFKLLPKPPDEMMVAFGGGLLTGIGAAFAGGCVIGNILSGVALMSVGNILFLVVVVLANWATTVLYLRGSDRGGA